MSINKKSEQEWKKKKYFVHITSTWKNLPTIIRTIAGRIEILYHIELGQLVIPFLGITNAKWGVYLYTYSSELSEHQMNPN